MIRLFLDNRTAVLLLIPFILGLYLLGSIYGFIPPISAQQNAPFLFENTWSSSWTMTFQFLLILLNSVFLNSVFNSHEFLDKNTYIISFIYTVLTPMFVPFNQFNPTLIAHFFIILSLQMLFELKQNTDGKMSVFNIGLMMGIATLFLPYLLISLPFFLVMIVIIRPFLWRELILFLCGAIIPWIYYLSYCYLTNQALFKWGIPSWQIHNMRFALNEYPVVIILVVLLVISLLSLGARLLKSSLRLKKQIQMLGLLLTCFLVIGGLDFYLSGSLFYLSLSILPLSYLLTYAFLSKRSGILASIFFYITFLYSFVKFFISFTG